MTVITIGISYRTDGLGKMYSENDKVKIEALNNLDLKKLLGLPIDAPAVEVRVKPLPRDAYDQQELVRSMSYADVQKDLEGIDLLYIPGGSTALDIQIGSSDKEKQRKQYEEEESFKKTKPGEDRKRKEYESRHAYEHKLIDVARTRGMGILAVCAGSWRLLENYGGGIRTLPKKARKAHANHLGVKLEHEISVQKNTMLHNWVKINSNVEDVIIQRAQWEQSQTNLSTRGNSTHWAVARVDANNRLVHVDRMEPLKEGLPPIKELEINAMAVTGDKNSNTVEGYESVSGAPVIGTQHHPEMFLPDRQEKNDQKETEETKKIKEFSQTIFTVMLQSALTYQKKRFLNKNVPSHALCEEGLKYYHGLGVTEDMKKAAEYFRLAAAQGHPGARQKLGDILQHGRAGIKDVKRAVELYEQAADSDDVMSMFCLGHCYEHANGVEQDLEYAAELYERAYNRGYEGWTGYYNKFLNRNPEMREYLAAIKMSTEQQYQEGLKYYHATGVFVDMKKAAIYFNLAAAQGHHGAQVKMGDICQHGRTGIRDIKKAAEFYKKAADGGNVMGMFCLGYCYEKGVGVEKNIERAAELYEEAYKKGYEGWTGYYNKFLNRNPEMREHLIAIKMSTEQQCIEGLKYYHAIGVVRDMNKAAIYLKLAAAQDHPEAQVKLGDIYQHGRAGITDLKKAVELYKQSAVQGNVMAIFFLARCCEHGTGIEKNLECAAELYQQAYNKGYEGWPRYFSEFLERNPSVKEHLQKINSKQNGNLSTMLLSKRVALGHTNTTDRRTTHSASLMPQYATHVRRKIHDNVSSHVTALSHVPNSSIRVGA